MDPTAGGRGRARRLAAALAAATAFTLGAAAPALACTTALPERPLAEYRAATPIVLGTVEQVDPMRITVRVEVTYRGTVDGRLTVRAPDPVLDWCAFPWGPPAVGDRVLIAVADAAWWQWPNSAVWVVDGRGRILNPVDAPWTGAPAPTTVAEALQAMGGAAPDSATEPWTRAEPPAGCPARPARSAGSAA